jgi:hypothetical protein
MRRDKLKEGIFFSDIIELKNKTPIQELLLDVIDTVNRRILKFYLHDESNQYDIYPPEMLVMVTANIFANLAQHIIRTSDSTIKIGAFNCLNDELFDLSKKLFMMLETHYATDEKTVN